MIATILLASVTVPAYAVSWTVLNPADYIASSTRDDNDIVYVTYDFNTSPLISYRVSGVQGGYATGISYDSVSIDIGSDYEFPVYFDMYPLGVAMPSGSPLSRVADAIAIEARDFRPNAALTVDSNISLSVKYNFDLTEEYSGVDYTQVVVIVKFFQYDGSGNYIGVISNKSNEVCPIPPTDEGIYRVPVSQTLSLSDVEDNLRYIVPHVYVQVTMPEDLPYVSVSEVSLSSSDFTISTRTDMLLQDSLTMQAIENQLEDLNDKADTIINGTDEQNQEAQDKQEQILDKSEQMDEYLEELDKVEKIDTSSAIETITNFLAGDGWYSVVDLLEPLLNWSHTATIMLIVVSFCTLSILFFGR